MKNMDLNTGGLIGALACGGIAATFVFSNVETADAGRGPYRFVIFALIGGAFAGNSLWGWMFKKPEQGRKRSVPKRPETDEDQGRQPPGGRR